MCSFSQTISIHIHMCMSLSSLIDTSTHSIPPMYSLIPTTYPSLCTCALISSSSSYRHHQNHRPHLLFVVHQLFRQLARLQTVDISLPRLAFASSSSQSSPSSSSSPSNEPDPSESLSPSPTILLAWLESSWKLKLTVGSTLRVFTTGY
jgi:hypothetical protein